MKPKSPQNNNDSIVSLCYCVAGIPMILHPAVNDQQSFAGCFVVPRMCCLAVYDELCSGWICGKVIKVEH